MFMIILDILYLKPALKTEPKRQTANTNNDVFFLLSTSLLDLLWPLCVLVGHEVQGVPETTSHVNKT